MMGDVLPVGLDKSLPTVGFDYPDKETRFNLSSGGTVVCERDGYSWVTEAEWEQHMRGIPGMRRLEARPWSD
jgi:hypothetical protein